LPSQAAAPEDAETKSGKDATVANATKAENATDPQSARPSTSAASAERLPTGLARQTPRVAASPAVRKRARELRTDLQAIRSAQDEARITHADLDALLSRRLGALGGVASTPIVNPPEVAILGLNRTAKRPAAQDGAIAVRKIMNLSSSFDHRVIDAWNAASFIRDVKRFLEQPSAIFID
jgi:2-oxoisovalerate dehydrogenase E2 component (dihydrolipoyl transacylase)